MEASATQSFSEQCRKIMDQHLQEFLDNRFIKALESGKVDSQALLTYVQQDHRYLDRYLPLYEKLYMAVTGEKVATEPDQDVKEYEAHQILLDHAHTNEDDLVSSDYANSAVTNAYLEHMEKATQEDDFVGLLSIFSCPFDYTYLANHMIREGLIKEDNPFFPWFNYYSDFNHGFTKDVTSLVDQAAKKASPEQKAKGLAAFEKSTEYEVAFFAQALED
ncbi:hypothetical protein [Eupransor demetentiae]|uniref:Aminopyrimidine aminohydrolase n=1 Tax=Eupransor demetentiae TaxID=3109584 RepID=A0ABM9N6P6_9LACO|nr:Aminopyrimidine aminohydrolase TenA (thiamine salvage pathway) (TenA) [Lactobacillaceae bacterium LMG 33000]